MLQKGEIKNAVDALNFLQTGDTPSQSRFSENKLSKIRELARNGGTNAEKAQAERILLKRKISNVVVD